MLARVSIVAFTFSEYSELGTSLHETPIKWHKFTFAKDKCKSFNHRLFSFSKNFNVTTSIRFIVRLFKQISDEVVSMEYQREWFAVLAIVRSISNKNLILEYLKLRSSPVYLEIRIHSSSFRRIGRLQFPRQFHENENITHVQFVQAIERYFVHVTQCVNAVIRLFSSPTRL